ncbi:MAG: UTRA domain-containing protein [Mangrovicoccus sp.]
MDKDDAPNPEAGLKSGPQSGSQTGSQSLHDRIRSDIEGHILSGHFPPGHKLASELELSEEYGCSRMTVNKVMTQLAAAGLILRRRRVGSVVLPQKSQNAVLEIHDIKEEVLARGGWYRHDILRREIRAENMAEDGDGTAGAPVLSVNCLHYSDEAPFCFEDRQIFLSAVPEAETADFSSSPPGAWLLEHVPWSEAENRIAARNPGEDVAGHLGITGHNACLTMTRRTWKNGEPVTTVRFWYPGHLHELVARFAPAQG